MENLIKLQLSCASCSNAASNAFFSLDKAAARRRSEALTTGARIKIYRDELISARIGFAYFINVLRLIYMLHFTFTML